MTLIAGIDIGSRSIEAVVLDGDTVVFSKKMPTTFDPLQQCRELFKEINAPHVVATGYGRNLLAESGLHPDVQTVTEIQAYALGARAVHPEARTILDIGGQDTKAISLLANGKTAKFEMNDRCAAGTGKFLEFMATALQIPIEEFGDFALQATHCPTINSMCSVFAETEAVSLMARGESPANIALGLHQSIVNRTKSMLTRVGITPSLVFAGGVARNPCVVKNLEKELGIQIVIPENPDMVGARGAAQWGRKHFNA
jgi:predicted CoA-substrate-specific enzyme activase